ncbi:hypothetical protein [Agromyces lapidis]|uniref:Uncharacterized protein n=1 Tax=Agromyces lapidis TaxID=279574 RepID=A0ABV5SPP9_9MICO|nr:hypothetical protein [Agromyces lapidis]
MNLRRLLAPLAIGGLVVCAAAAGLTVAGAYGVAPFEPPFGEVQSAGVSGGLDAAAASASTDDDVVVVEPFSSELESTEERSEYMGREQVIAECMSGQGVEYLPAAPWLNQNKQPRGLSFEQSVIWLNAYYGEQRDGWSVPASEWERRGCLGVGDHAVAVARAAGTPLSAPLPEPDPEALTWEEAAAVYQAEVDACMTEHGFGVDDDGTAAWELAMWGDTGAGAAYRWEDAGCAGYATHVTGNDNMH